jgi:RND family efflux transporter MFP subunit
MNHRDRVIAAIFALSVSFVGVLSSCSSENRAAPAAQETVGGVHVIIAQKTKVPDWLEVTGTVRAAQTSEISSQMMGNIVEMRVREGDRVQSGEVLAVIDDAQPRSALKRAEAAATAAGKEVSAAETEHILAEATLKRYQQLYEKKSVSPQEYDEVKARSQSAEARMEMARAGQEEANAALAQAKTSLSYARIRAPFSGVVTAKKADAGTLASPGTALFTLEDTRKYRLEATVDESDIRLVHAGQEVPVRIDALEDAQLSGRVAQIVPAADAASRSFLVKIDLPSDARLRSGLFGRAHFLRGERDALVIPSTALVERGQLQGVYVLGAGEIAELRYVTTGQPSGGQVEILSGLEGGERLVGAPGSRELGGKRIAIRP